jgi:hypothetical protein
MQEGIAEGTPKFGNGISDSLHCTLISPHGVGAPEVTCKPSVLDALGSTRGPGSWDSLHARFFQPPTAAVVLGLISEEWGDTRGFGSRDWGV